MGERRHMRRNKIIASVVVCEVSLRKTVNKNVTIFDRALNTCSRHNCLASRNFHVCGGSLFSPCTVRKHLDTVFGGFGETDLITNPLAISSFLIEKENAMLLNTVIKHKAVFSKATQVHKKKRLKKLVADLAKLNSTHYPTQVVQTVVVVPVSFCGIDTAVQARRKKTRCNEGSRGRNTRTIGQPLALEHINRGSCTFRLMKQMQKRQETHEFPRRSLGRTFSPPTRFSV